jgi:hypothetical protein
MNHPHTDKELKIKGCSGFFQRRIAHSDEISCSSLPSPQQRIIAALPTMFLKPADLSKKPSA